MDETTSRSVLVRMPDLHRMFRERTNGGRWILQIDFLVIAIWMFGDRQLVSELLEKFRGKRVIIEGGGGDFMSDDLYRAIVATDDDRWLECVEMLVDQIPHPHRLLEDLEFKIRCEHTMQLVNVVLDRLRAVRSLRVCVYGSTGKFIRVLDTLRPLDYLTLDGITHPHVFWSKMLKYAFLKPPREGLRLVAARDSRLFTSFKTMRSTATFIPHVGLLDCVIDDELLSLLMTMPVSSISLENSSRIRGNFLTAANVLADNTRLERLTIACDEVCSSFAEALSHGLANNTKLQELTIRLSAVEPFLVLCRGVGRNCSIRKAELLVSSPIDDSCMYELAQSPSLHELHLIVGIGPGVISWPAVATYLRANQSLKILHITGLSERNDASEDDFRIMGQSLADNTSLKTLFLAMRWGTPPRTGFAKFVSELGCNTTLRCLLFTESSYPDTPPSTAAFERAIERNYGLEDITFKRGGRSPLVQTICKLNEAGRKYMLVDPTSRVLGVHVLNRVIYDLDCLYYHLRENPSLCNLSEVGHDMASSPAQSRKRRKSLFSTTE